ncbi:hypothetical protein ACIGXA_39250 [Streptomyces fildesensis]|uniref:Uncharacterized protein n=1 Tax=Streptomyces fildesensis TaxID=375757 RepID=A0ABW8CJC1_9ACTN
MPEEKSEYYLVLHTHEFEAGDEDLKIIGLYRSAELAASAVARAKELPGFKDVPEGFEIVPYKLDVDGWLAGYVTVYDEEDENEGDGRVD